MGKVKAFYMDAFESGIEMGLDHDEAEQYAKDSVGQLTARVHGKNFDAAMGWSARDILSRLEADLPISLSELGFLNDSDFATKESIALQKKIFTDINNGGGLFGKH